MAVSYKIQQILDAGTRRDFFVAGDSAGTAGIIVNAFTEYWSPPLIIARTPEEVFRDAGNMCDFVMKAIGKRS